MKCLHGLNINAWYLDDGTLCGSAADLSAALAIIEEDGPSRGLKLNRKKSLLYIPEDASFVANPLPPEIPFVRSGFDLLGSPIGPPSHCEASMMKRVLKVQEILKRLPDLQDSQMECTILRYCLALPKISFTLRSCPPQHVKNAISALTSQCWRHYLILLVDPFQTGSSISWWSRYMSSLFSCHRCLYRLSRSV